MCTSPKLTLKEFDGDVTKWGTFWDSFESAIHGNPKPSAIYYLHSLIKGSAAEAKAGLALISSNYEEAVTLLKKRFGIKQQRISKHMEVLLNLEPVTSSRNTKSLIHLYDKVKIQCLKSLGVTPSSYGSVLASILMSKIPHDLCLIVKSPEYDKIIKDHIDQGIVEVVEDPWCMNTNKLHYLPHHGIIRENKLTTKLRVVYNASAKNNGPSLNDCLYAGPSFGQRITDILFRFRLYPVALVTDIEKAFLMICIAEDDRDVLRFLWLEDIKNELPRIQVLRFTRVVFGVSSSPFLLNATIKHHIQSYLTRDPQFVTKFEQSIYVDDVGPTMMMRHSSFMRRRRLDWQKVVSISASLLPTPQSCKRINLQEVIGVTQFHTGQSEKIAAENFCWNPTATFVAARTRVFPLQEHSIPRLELLGALLLSKLLASVSAALMVELELEPSTCFTDSKVALF
ncbi:hypothetical protein EMCRGX_G012988 [Ephydatia muelleri]